MCAAMPTNEAMPKIGQTPTDHTQTTYLRCALCSAEQLYFGEPQPPAVESPHSFTHRRTDAQCTYTRTQGSTYARMHRRTHAQTHGHTHAERNAHTRTRVCAKGFKVVSVGRLNPGCIGHNYIVGRLNPVANKWLQAFVLCARSGCMAAENLIASNSCWTKKISRRANTDSRGLLSETDSLKSFCGWQYKAV